MADVEAVTIRKASDQLAEDAYGFWFWKPAVGDYVFEKLPTFDILQYEVSAKSMSVESSTLY